MFENLSQREKILTLVVLSLLPIGVIFMGAMWFMGRYSENNREIMSLQDQISTQDNKYALARKAEKRLEYYHFVSLPSDYSPSLNRYQQWLRDQFRDHGFSQATVNPGPTPTFSHGTKELGQTQTFKTSGNANLEQLVGFLNQFYTVDTLHRIQSLSIIPETTSGRGGEEQTRTGRLTINMEIEVLILADAFGNEEFENRQRQLPDEMQFYVEQIAGRNIFGPPNNSPILAFRPARSYPSYEKFNIIVSADDADKDDKLKFELVSSDIEGIEADQLPGKREVRLSIPPQQAGTYSLTVRVFDDGFPSKEDIAEYQIDIQDRPNQKPSIEIANLESSYPPDQTIEITLVGKDRDEQDELEFDLLEAPEGTQLVNVPDQPREKTILIPAQDVGQFDVVVSVSDGREADGEDPIEKSFTVKVERKFSHFQETRITSILRESNGQWLVNVRVRTLGQRHSLGVGDSFKLEGQEWILESITPNSATFRTGNQLKTFNTNAPFTSPSKVETFVQDESGVTTVMESKPEEPSGSSRLSRRRLN